MSLEDHYAVLSVPQFASADEVRKSYKKLALKFHPDKNKAVGAEEKFKKIHDSYKVLTDKAAKASYDVKLRAKTSSTAARSTSTTTRGKNGTTTTTTRTTFTKASTTTTRATFNPKPSAQQQSPSHAANNYKNRNFDHLFTKSNVNVKQSPTSKFHYSNFDRSSTTPLRAANTAKRGSSPQRSTKGDTATSSSSSATSVPRSMFETGKRSGSKGRHRVPADRAQEDEEEEEEDGGNSSNKSTNPFQGQGKEEDPIVLDDTHEPDHTGTTSYSSAQVSQSEDDDDQEDKFVDADSNPQNQAPASPRHKASRFNSAKTTGRGKRYAQAFNSDAKRYRFSGEQFDRPKGPSGRPSRTFMEEQENVEIMEDAEEEHVAGPDDLTRELPAFHVHNVPPFTRNYGDINLNDVDESLNDVSGMNPNPRKVRATSTSVHYENGKRFRRDKKDSERLAHEPVNSYAYQYAQSAVPPPPPPMQQTDFVNDHPIFYCRLPVQIDHAKRIRKISLDDLIQVQFDLRSPTPPNMDIPLNSITDVAQLLNHFYVYEEQFKMFQTSYLSYMKLRTEADVFQMKNVLGYNRGTEHMTVMGDKLIDLDNLALYHNVMANDSLLHNEYSQSVQDHLIALSALHNICSEFLEGGMAPGLY